MIEDLKNRKASGPDEIHNELIKYGGEELTSQLVTLFQNVLNSGTIPSECKKNITIPVFKKGDKKDLKITEKSHYSM